jgi:hypothetical protein
MALSETYVARALEGIQYGVGTWRGTRVGVFRVSGGLEEQVGEYERNYPSLLRTFAAFRLDGRDLALYSPDYTCTRLLELPSCRDIGGEEPSAGGFCPADFFVPYYIDLEYFVDGRPSRLIRRQMPKAEELAPRTVPVKLPETPTHPARIEQHRYVPVGPRTFHPFGFVAGCVWGDDSSWKVQYLDLSRAAEGVIVRDDRFGYIELPDGVRLDGAVDLVDYQSDPDEDYAYQVSITTAKRFDLRNGRAIDPLA